MSGRCGRRDHRERARASVSDSGNAGRNLAERVLFDRPLLYRIKRFVIERVIWDFVLSGIFRMDPRPIPERVPDLGGKRVLLAASGPGDATTGPAIDAAAEITAFDLSPHFARACAANHPDWRVYCGNLLSLPHADDAFDVAVLYSSLHHVPVAAERVLLELSRVSAERVVIVEGVVPERGFLRTALLVWYRLVDGGHHYYSQRELHAAAESIGWRVAREDLHGPIRHMWFATLSPPSPLSSSKQA
ncbi:MAG: methyltransferase domain-containing protein [Myxococcota bacterium]|nr:methyltransferase domain-containing protein [Myxococcota bacterium]